MTANSKLRFSWLRALLTASVAVSFLGFLMASFVKPFSGVRDNEDGRTEILIAYLETALESYKAEHGDYPSSTEDGQVAKLLIGDKSRKGYFAPNAGWINSKGEFIDGWGTPLHFRRHTGGGGWIEIISAGPDKIFGTADDITNQ
jgi:type II secretory pathway pseudopilin PulG